MEEYIKNRLGDISYYLAYNPITMDLCINFIASEGDTYNWRLYIISASDTEDPDKMVEHLDKIVDIAKGGICNA